MFNKRGLVLKLKPVAKFAIKLVNVRLINQ